VNNQVRLPNEKYWVASQGEEPTKIYFSAILAFNSNEPYIDTFDEKGNWVRAFKRISDLEYTTEF
jgi:hypothetical protein